MLEENRWKLYVSAGVTFLVLLINVIAHFPDAVADYENYPTMSYGQMVSEFEYLREEVKKPILNYKQFFARVDRIYILEMAGEKYKHEHPRLDPRIADPFVSIMMSINFLRSENEERGRVYNPAYQGEFEKAQKNRDTRYHTVLMNAKVPAGANKNFLSALKWFQLGFMPFAFLIFAVRVWDEGGVISLECATNLNFYFSIIFWEVGLFRYKGTHFRVQARRMVQYACLGLTAALSFGSATLKAQTKEKDENPTAGDNHTLVISGSTEYLSEYLGLDGAIFYPNPVFQSSLTVAHKNGLYVDVFKSIATTHSNISPNFGFEEDYGIGYSRKWRKRTVDASVTYFNVTPLGRLARGDVLQTAVMITNFIPALHVSNYLWVRDLHPTGGGKPLSGQFVHFGVNRNMRVSKVGQIALSAEAVFDSGALGYKRAGIFRSSAAFKVPWKKLVFELPVYRMSSPFTHPGDGRKFEQVLGIGMSFSFAQ